MVKSRSPFLTSLPIFEMHGIERACDTRADFDGIHRDEAADILVLIDDLAG